MFIIHVLKLDRIFNLSVLLRFLYCLISCINFFVPVMLILHTSVLLRDIMALGFWNICTTKSTIRDHTETYQNCKTTNTDLNDLKVLRIC